MTHAVDKFDGEDFMHWKMCMVDYQYGKMLNKPLETTTKGLVNFDDEFQALILLASLPKRAAVSNSVGNEKLKLTVVQERCLSEEVRKTDMRDKSSALNVERGRNCDMGNSKNKWRSK
ncbi:hypothetical protein LIER_35241 [Lithospermum erythrorhizon]|uniref:Uncharacterized protein n=1 Tax=Lithospermum erythrorhizon TaxID=34254 RepID=A0AAV3NMZ2_LITER